MLIRLIPQRRDDTVKYSVRGDVLIINGEQFDFSPLWERDLLPDDAVHSSWVVGDITRVEGEIELSLLLPTPWNYSQQQAFPVPIRMTVDGVVPLPEPLPDITLMTTPIKEPVNE